MTLSAGRQRAALADLSEWDENPRRISDEAIAALRRSLEAEPELLEARPLIALPDGTVIAGNMRLRALRDMGAEEATVHVVDADRNRAREIALRDNNQFGEWEDGALALMIAGLVHEGADVLAMGFDEPDIDHMLRSISPGGADDPDEYMPPVPREATTVPGDVIRMGGHVLLCGDATQRECWETVMSGRRFSLAVTSPPYNQRLDKFTPSGMQKENPAWVDRMASAYADSMPEDAYQDQQTRVLNLMYDFAAEGASVFYNHKVRYRDKAAVFPTAWVQASNWRIRQEIIWDRHASITLNARMFMPQDERIYWLTRDRDFLFADTAEVKSWGSVWQIAPRAEIQESAPYPMEIPVRAITACSKVGDLVVDPYGGSGTTMIAAEKMGRRCAMIELDPGYCDVIVARWEKLTGKTAQR